MKAGDEDERKRQPDLDARTPQGDTPHHIESQWQQNRRLGDPQRIVFGIGEDTVGDNQRCTQVKRQHDTETAACLDFCSSALECGCVHNPLPVRILAIGDIEHGMTFIYIFRSTCRNPACPVPTIRPCA